jgi:hypothetical protein
MVVRGLTRGTTYWFAIKTVDDAGDWSAISNVVQWDWSYDTAPPSAPTELTAAKQGDGTVRVSWSPNSEADLAGYEVCRALSAGGPFNVLNGALVTTTEYRGPATSTRPRTLRSSIRPRRPRRSADVPVSPPSLRYASSPASRPGSRVSSRRAGPSQSGNAPSNFVPSPMATA